jgi:transcription regulator MmyB-like protein
MLHLIFDPDGMRPFVENWADVAVSLMQRVKSEATGGVIDEKTKELLTALLAYPGVRTASTDPMRRLSRRSGLEPMLSSNDPILPIIPIGFRKDEKLLNYFSMVTTVGTPQTVASQERRIESMFPADEETESQHLILLGQNTLRK